MAQPNASRAIAQLELALEFPLLQRSPRGSRLTENGLLIVDWARAVLDSAEQLNLGAAALRSGPRAALRVAASMTVASDRLVVVVSPEHRWANAKAPISLPELARMPLVVREAGSGTREAADAVLARFDPVPPVQVLNSNAAVRVSVTAGAGPAILSELAAAPALRSNELRRVQVSGLDAARPLTAVWIGPRRLAGAAAELVSTAVETGPGPQG